MKSNHYKLAGKSLVLVALASLFWFPQAASGQDEGWGHLTGKITVTGKVPAAGTLTVDKDAATCLRDQDEILDQSLIVGEDGGLKNAFVMMYINPRDEKRPEIHESYEATQDDKVVLDNVKCRFEPHALFLRTSQTLTMKNSDDVGHNCHVTLMKNEENPNIPANAEVEVQLTESERFPGPVNCDIHKWMKAVLLVRDEPYVAISDADGSFTIENLPEGDWTFQFWHERCGLMKGLTRDGEELLEGRRGTVEFTIKSGETLDLGELKIAAEDLEE